MHIFIFKKRFLLFMFCIICSILLILFSLSINNSKSLAISITSNSSISENLQTEISNLTKQNKKIAYLTFDDGPRKRATPKILDILKDENIKATFFVIGKYVKENPDLIKREYSEGHFIANHGYDHNNSTLYKNKESFRKSISIVNQEPILFNMSIKENLLVANESATDKEIIDACKLANIDLYIEELPNKYNEIITENSTNFSVGQKQRLAIARAILRDTPIILFDEATSALDNYSKNKIKETMKELAQNKTIIIISHTLDLVKDCDNIIYIEDGQILEGGNHNTLIEEKGKYYELINNSI